jgi:gluconokinase
MRPLVLVMTGVAGSGKSVVGRLVAADFGWPFADGDDLHSAENVAKMRAGRPLTDAERGPWLRQIARWIGEHSATGGVIACSALRRAYRDLLRDGHPDVRFACLTARRDVLAARLADRPSHFMPASLLDSQLDAFEPLAPDEPGATFDTSGTPEQTAAAVVTALGGRRDS